MRNRYNEQAKGLAAEFTGDPTHDAIVWRVVSAIARHESRLNPRFDAVRFARYIDANRVQGGGVMPRSAYGLEEVS